MADGTPSDITQSFLLVNSKTENLQNYSALTAQEIDDVVQVFQPTEIIDIIK